MYLSKNPAIPPYPAIVCCHHDRTQQKYLAAVRQFGVETNERYRVRDTSGDGQPDTFCNIFVTDCVQALGGFLPYWWLGRELSANAIYDWLLERGDKYGWEKLNSAHTAVATVMSSMITIAAWKNHTGRSGHMAILLPIPTDDDTMPYIAQAGRVNFVGKRLQDGFGNIQPTFFACR